MQIVPVAICLMSFVVHMMILFIIKVEIVALIKWSYISFAPHIILFIINLKNLVIIKWSYSIFWALSPISFKHVFFLSILDTLNHIPPKYRHRDYLLCWISTSLPYATFESRRALLGSPTPTQFWCVSAWIWFHIHKVKICRGLLRP